MGCEVNGPGEARAADVGIAGGRGGWLLFVRGPALAAARKRRGRRGRALGRGAAAAGEHVESGRTAK